MKNLLCTLSLLLCLALSQPASGQTWLAPNQTWTYDVFGGWDPRYYGQHTLRVEGDTTIQGIVCKRMRQYYPDTALVPSTHHAYHEDGRVYVHEPWAGEFLKIYDFNLSNGDTVHIQQGRWYTVDSVGALLVDGSPRRFQIASLYGNPLYLGRYLLIEGLGMVNGAGADQQQMCNFFFINSSFCSAPVDGWTVTFHCFADGDLFYNPFGLCTPTVVSMAEAVEARALLPYPNPAHTDFTLVAQATGSGTLQVFDATGRRCAVQAVGDASLPITVSVAHLPIGNYTMILRTEQAALRGRVLVQR